MNGGDDYEKDLTSSDEMEFLTGTNDVRIEEEISRPRVEIWPYDGWQAWVALHEKGKRNVPAFVSVTIGKIAEIKKIEAEEAKRIIFMNYKRIFG